MVEIVRFTVPSFFGEIGHHAARQKSRSKSDLDQIRFGPSDELRREEEHQESVALVLLMLTELVGISRWPRLKLWVRRDKQCKQAAC
ncbi:hypothetical protein VTN49DRAFT_1852 [Thermomyces lanuginosus]|uniref:uncharacterized protein n=1 Tax=Thermomyces lanuginosus TaxID=5541 RepID=UPI0037446981